MNKKQHIDKKDNFGESIKSKLENYQMPLDESVWSGIEKQLTPKKNRIVPLWYWISGGIAASFVLFFLLNPLKNNSSQIAINKPLEIKNTQISKNISAKNITTAASANDINNTANYTSRNQSKINKTSIGNNVQRMKVEENTFITEKKEENTVFQTNEVNTGIAKSDLQKKDSIPAKITEPKLTSLPEIPEILEIPIEKTSKKPKHTWFLAANAGTSGNANSNFSSEKNTFSTTSNSAVRETYGIQMSKLAYSADVYIMEPSEFTNVKHLNPVSVGFAIQKSLTSNIGVSSGLIYTYLHSTFAAENTWRKADATLDLHYVGIPLNMNVTIADKKKWNYYFSAGGTIEKGLRSVYKQSIKYQSSEQNTNVYSKIDGMQTSANAAFGVGFKLQKNWNLYLEPKITYYFKNNQPMSARTDTPLNVGVNGGLKVGF